MEMNLLPKNAAREDILNVLTDWTELLAQEKYDEAFAMFPCDCPDLEWTPWLLESAIYTYGCPGYTRKEAQEEFGSADYKATSLLNSPYKDEVLEAIKIDYFTLTREQGRMMMVKDYERVIGDIHYDKFLLNGEISDLTARFWIKKWDNDKIVLVFQDLHVM